jgi:hypothetical protein
MMAHRQHDEDDDWETDWDDGPDDDDAEADDDDEPTIECPSCRREILEDSPRCPYCEHYLSAEDLASPRRPMWVIVTAIVCLAAVLWWLRA